MQKHQLTSTSIATVVHKASITFPKHSCSSFEQGSCASYNPNNTTKQALWPFRLEAEGCSLQPFLIIIIIGKGYNCKKYSQSCANLWLQKHCWPQDLPCSPLINFSLPSTAHIGTIFRCVESLMPHYQTS